MTRRRPAVYLAKADHSGGRPEGRAVAQQGVAQAVTVTAQR